MGLITRKFVICRLLNFAAYQGQPTFDALDMYQSLDYTSTISRHISRDITTEKITDILLNGTTLPPRCSLKAPGSSYVWQTVHSSPVYVVPL